MEDSLVEVSVVISIHKVALFLEDCLNSVIAQTYKDIEILCIVNDSPDSCEEIARSYEFDSRVVVIVQNELGGLGGARNLGLERSCGRYILFVDGDDILSKDYIRLLYEGMSEGVDIVYTPNIIPFMDSPRSSKQNLKILLDKEKLLKKKEDTDVILSTFEQKAERSIQTPWGYSTANKLFRKDFLLIQGLRFPIFRLHEDGIFSIRSWLSSKNVLFLSPNKDLFYFYRKHPHSITVSHKAAFLDAYKTFRDMPEIYSSGNNPTSEEEQTKIFMHILVLHWLFSISCYELRNFNWLFHPNHFLSSLQIDKILYKPLQKTKISSTETPFLTSILTFFQKKNLLSWSYFSRKIFWIMAQKQIYSSRYLKDEMSLQDVLNLQRFKN